ncbi:MAG: adenylate/guanylate cyclase domain-containing protein [Oligoflexus sp.]|nr:adenylate/guanylate cyclase domain-containing protein [Oligoflexus sp.]
MKTDAELIAEYNDNTFYYVGFFAKWLSPGLYILFLIADYTVMRNNFYWCVFIRFWMLPISFLVAKKLNRHTDFESRQKIAFWFVLANGLLLLPLIFLAGGFYSNYFAGLMLVMIGGLGFLPFRKNYSVAVYSILIFLYYVVCLVKNGFSVQTIMMLLTNSLFLFGAVILSIFVRKSFTRYENISSVQRLRLQESMLELEAQRQSLVDLNQQLRASEGQLQNTLYERERVIKEKTEENIHFHFLKSHFSPQVISHLKKGQTAKLKSEICVMFVDIVDSTLRLNSIDEHKFNKVISYFIDEVSQILLKHNVTIDKFLGDGIVAYANHPIRQENYLEIVCQAAVEIKDHFQAHKALLENLWDAPFEVRIGIASGTANIGSYGSFTQHYTGIGGVFNLSQRVCSIAGKNQVYVTSDIFDNLSKDTFHLKPAGLHALKGYKESVNMFEIVGYNMQLDGIMCPNGHGKMRLTVNRLSQYVTYCDVCGHEDA